MEPLYQPGDYAVLTGDVVDWSQWSAERKKGLVRLLERIVAEWQEHFPEAGSTGVDVFRGDSFQLALSNPRLALKCAIYIRTSIGAEEPVGRSRNGDARIAMGIGPIDRLSPRISQSQGEAFLLSGRLLDDFDERRRLGFSFGAQRDAAVAKALWVIVSLLDLRISGWSSLQCFAVARTLAGMTQAQIAEAWQESLSQSAVQQRLAAADWEICRRAIEWVETVPDRL